jgi:hypothetical protein
MPDGAVTEDMELAIRIARLEHKLMRRLEKRQFYTERVERTRRQLAELHAAYAAAQAETMASR